MLAKARVLCLPDYLTLGWGGEIMDLSKQD